MSEDERLPGPDTLTRLARGALSVDGQIPWSSNATFVVSVEGATPLKAIYKPEQGERRLWDFPPGLYRRERAAYVLADVLQLAFIPETVVRDDAPMGPGSLQRVVDIDGEHYFTLRGAPEVDNTMRQIAAFDVLMNNADRKSGHVVRDLAGHIWAIDHGLCFHPEPKLRTVMWDFAGEPYPSGMVKAIAENLEAACKAVSSLLDGDEVTALYQRARQMIDEARFPVPDSEYPLPWPLV